MTPSSCATLAPPVAIDEVIATATGGGGASLAIAVMTVVGETSWICGSAQPVGA